MEFGTTSGHYHYSVMAYGLVNAVWLRSFFQAFMNDVFREMLNSVIVYLNDILIYSKTYSEHVSQVGNVIHRLHKHGLYAKAKKCEFHKRII